MLCNTDHHTVVLMLCNTSHNTVCLSDGEKYSANLTFLLNIWIMCVCVC
jgi:hypothetical protein